MSVLPPFRPILLIRHCHPCHHSPPAASSSSSVSTVKYPGSLAPPSTCLLGPKSILGLASPELIFLIAWKVACSLVCPLPGVNRSLVCSGGVEAGVPALLPTLLPLRLSIPLQLVASLSGGAGGALFLRTLGMRDGNCWCCGGGLLAACSTRGYVGRSSVPKLDVGSANSRKM